MNPQLPLAVRIHCFEERKQVRFLGRRELDRDVHVSEAQRVDCAQFIRQRVAWIVMERQVDDRCEGRCRDGLQLPNIGLTGGAQRGIYLSVVVDAGKNGLGNAGSSNA